MIEEIKDPIYEGDDDSQEQDIGFTEYDISVSPNDFNVSTIDSYINKGIFEIPGFQRNYVWDKKRASKLIESLLIGIPIPQLFLYEQGKNNLLVIDGQQRLLTIYFFKQKRFPKMGKRIELRKIFKDNKVFPENILANNEYFEDFNLSLPATEPNKENKFNKLNYLTLSEDDRNTFDLRTIRNIIIKQNSPNDGDSVIFEIFNRLNSGGINLKPQEIRTSLYHSKFYEMLYRINLDDNWRKLTPKTTPDLNMKDVEIILRGFAMLVNHSEYKPSMVKFLNAFSSQARKYSDEDIQYLENLFKSFVSKVAVVNEKLFFNNDRFNIVIYESIFVALTEDAYLNKNFNIKTTTTENVQTLKDDPDFKSATIEGTAGTAKVKSRIERAKELL